MRRLILLTNIFLLYACPIFLACSPENLKYSMTNFDFQKKNNSEWSIHHFAYKVKKRFCWKSLTVDLPLFPAFLFKRLKYEQRHTINYLHNIITYALYAVFLFIYEEDWVQTRKAASTILRFSTSESLPAGANKSDPFQKFSQSCRQLKRQVWPLS